MVKIIIPPTAAEMAAFVADMARLRSTIAETAPEVAPAPAPPAPAFNPRAPRIAIDEAFRPETRADLADQPGYSHLNADENGNPIVWAIDYTCKICGYFWSSEFAPEVPADCPRCGVHVHTGFNMRWIGPQDHQVNNLWDSLPDRGAVTAPAPDAPRLHLSEPTMVDPKTEAVWLAVQAITKAREAGMTDDELLESAQMQMHDDEDNTIISRSAPKWAWDVIDEVMGNVAARGADQSGAACAALLGHGVTREESAAAWEEML